MSTTTKLASEHTINDLIAPQQKEFTLPEGIVADGADLIPTVQYLM
ncbi:hypothetical protein [Paraburkholderia strydomiana]|nr:hypothetical protein [Paraburkholderia strydomiana]MDR7006208.1 hypothetical protein [Paraburkholderia strydomiana]